MKSEVEADLQGAASAYDRRDFAEAAVLFERAFAADPEGTRKYRPKLAHVLVLSMPWDKIDALIPQGTNSLRASGWLESIYGNSPVGADGRPIPWMAYPATEFLEHKVPPGSRIFEWGSGASTFWWAERAAEVHSIEHDGSWARHVAAQAPPHASITHCPEGASYPAAIQRFPEDYFDVIVIDGVQRAACAAIAPTFAKPTGFIVLDNSDRSAEAEAVAALDSAGWLRIDFCGLTPGNLYRSCTSVFFRDAQLLRGRPYPNEAISSLGPTCAQAMNQ